VKELHVVLFAVNMADTFPKTFYIQSDVERHNFEKLTANIATNFTLLAQ